MMVGN